MPKASPPDRGPLQQLWRRCSTRAPIPYCHTVAGITNQSQHSFPGITGTDSESFSTESHPGHYSLRSGLELCQACSVAPGLPSLPSHGGGGSAQPPRLDHLSFRIVPASWMGGGLLCLSQHPWLGGGSWLSALSQPWTLTHTLAPLRVRGEAPRAGAAVAPQLVLTAVLAAVGPVTLVHICETWTGPDGLPGGPLDRSLGPHPTQSPALPSQPRPELSRAKPWWHSQRKLPGVL